jgi:AcrR family transcriptional regulator
MCTRVNRQVRTGVCWTFVSPPEHPPVESSPPEAERGDPGPDSEAPTRDRLLASAAALLAQHGSFDRVSLRAIAAGAGVTPTAVYRHFDDHADVLANLAAWCWGRFDEAVFAASSSIADPGERFAAQGQAYLEFAGRHPAIYRVLFDRRFDDLRRVDDGAVVFAKLVEVIAEILAERGDSRPPIRVAAMVHTWIHGIATLDAPSVSGYPSPLELLQELGVRVGLEPASPPSPPTR